MDLEVGEPSTTAADSHEATGRPLSNISYRLEKPTPWETFKAAVIRYRAIFLFLALAVTCFSGGLAVYLATMRNEWINIHLVPHSHDDVGWLRTPEQYYEYSVKYILNNVIHELQRNPHRKFIYVETYFFWRWWKQQSENTQVEVRELVNRGQLHFVGGAWSMNDEATPNYQNVIDQFTWGLRRLNDTFGERARPQVAWQIDTFGHSREMASLAALMGYRGLFFARIDEEERSQRRDKRSMEFMWRDRGGATSILTSVMYKHYNPPSGYHYEKETNEGPNLDGFLEAIREWARAYKTNNVLVPMGDDFTYYDARAWFDNMDHLIRLVEERKNSGINVNLFYSTPMQYLSAIQDTPTAWPIKQGGDFFPYGSDTFSYWSGYFTSRPSLKLFERVTSNFLQMAKQMAALTTLSADSEERLTELREALGVLIHHDAITGTAKQDVTNHYVDLLHRALTLCLLPVMEAVGLLNSGVGKAEPLPYGFCLQLNISQCFFSERSSTFVVMVYNSLSWPVSRAVRLPVLWPYYTITNAQGEIVPYQIVPLPKEILRIPGRASSAVEELVFLTGSVPPLGFTSFHIKAQSSPETPPRPQPLPQNNLLEFNRFTGRLKSVTLQNKTYALRQDLEYYYGSSFWTGAYIFRPAEPYTYPVGGSESLAMNLVANGPLVTEMHQTLGPWASQVLRIYRGSPVLEVEWLIGPVPIQDYHGKEVVVRYSSDIRNDGEFFTDTNGRGSLPRKRDKRDDWVYKPHEIISGNYYPVTSHISLRDGSSQMFVLTDRPQGGASIIDGQLELMVHRRLCYDDGKGVNEPLNETAYGEGLVVRGRHWILLGGSDPKLEQIAERLANELQYVPLLLFAATDLDALTWRLSHLTSFSGLTSSLPPNVRVLTLEPWKDDLLLLRLEHMYERNSAQPLSLPVDIQLRRLFTAFEITAVRETMLGADRWVPNDRGWISDFSTVTLQPAEIRTFLVQTTPRTSHP